MSRPGVIVGTVESAQLPALYAATPVSAWAGALYGPRGLGHLGGPPAEQTRYSRLRSADEACRVWEKSAELVA